MKTWTDVAVKYFNENKLTACPRCCSENVKVTQGKHGNRIWVDFTCEDCNSADHFDGFAKPIEQAGE